MIDHPPGSRLLINAHYTAAASDNRIQHPLQSSPGNTPLTHRQTLNLAGLPNNLSQDRLRFQPPSQPFNHLLTAAAQLCFRNPLFRIITIFHQQSLNLLHHLIRFTLSLGITFFPELLCTPAGYLFQSLVPGSPPYPRFLPDSLQQ